MSEKWIPFPEVATATDSEIAVGWTGMPSGFDDERLLLNVGALRTGVIGWGGYESLYLAGYSGDEDRREFGVGGVNADGSGVASGVVAETKAEASQIDSNPTNTINPLVYRNGSLSIKWNTASLNGELAASEQFDPHIRARQLNKIVRNQAIKATVRHSLVEGIRDSGKNAREAAVFFDVLNIGVLGAAVATKDIPMTSLALAGRGAMTAAPYAENREAAIADPLLLCARPLRAILAAGTLASQRLVAAA